MVYVNAIRNLEINPKKEEIYEVDRRTICCIRVSFMEKIGAGLSGLEIVSLPTGILHAGATVDVVGARATGYIVTGKENLQQKEL